MRAVLGVLLACATLAVYAPAVRNDFVKYDDFGYVVENPHARGGFTAETFRWAFTTFDDGLWAPLTRLSHVLDYQLFGRNPAGHHLHNVLLHILSTVLLYGFLLRATGRMEASLLAAALFALHPMHVEPVAWVASRKDMLSTVFLMFTLLAYDFWARQRSVGGMAAAVAAFGLALLAKPMVVTLPFALVLLDVWPYRRIDLQLPWREQLAALRRVLIEKIPLFAAAALVSFITTRAEKVAIASIDYVGFSVRIMNVLTSYVTYVFKCLVPYPLYVPYLLYPNTLHWGAAVACAIALACVTVAAWHYRNRAPYALVGWLWFLGTLTPVIGLVQFGHHARADRFTYVPFIGLFIAVAWGWDACLRARSNRRRPLIAMAFAVLAVYAALAGVQIRYWHDTVTLFNHTLAWDEPNFIAHSNLAHRFLEQNHPDLAAQHFERVCRLDPRNTDAQNNLGVSYLLLGRYAEAAQILQKLVKQTPNDPEVWMNLAAAKYYQKAYAESREALDHATTLAPKLDKAPTLKKMLDDAERK